MQNRTHAIASAIVSVVLTTTAAAGAMTGDPDEGLAPGRPRSVAPSGRRGRTPEVEKAKSVRPVLAESLGAQLSPLPPDVEIKTRFVLAGRSRGETVVLGDDEPPPVPIRVGAKVHRITVTEGADGATVVVPRTVTGDPISCEDSDNAVYCNTLGNAVFGPGGAVPGRFADDIVTIALAPIGDLNLNCCGQFCCDCCDPEDETCCRHCDLDRFKIRVTGDMSQDPDCVGEEYTVTFALYPTCPGANRDATPIAGTEMEVLIPAAQACDIVEVERLISSFSSIQLPNQLYLGVKFSRPGCAWVVGAPATVGFSADAFDFPGFPCYAGLGGFPAVPHASFYAEIYVRDGCLDSFPGYRNSSHVQLSVNPGLQVRFADDITLGVPLCNLVAYEIAHKRNAILAVDLRTHLDANDPELGGVIEGTAAFLLPHDLDVEIGRVEVDPPIPLPQTFFLTVKSTTAGGPILTCKRADIGETTDLYFVYNSGLGEWVPVVGTNCWGGLDVTIYCEGLPPMGACCDMVLTNDRTCVGGPHQGSPCSRNTDCRVCVGGSSAGERCSTRFDCPDGECPESWVCVGESVCRQLPEINCASTKLAPTLWIEGGRCGAVCIGGVADGRHCAVDADCAVCVEGGRDGEPCCPGGACDTATGRCESGYRDRSVCCPGGACSTGTCEGSFCIGGENNARACARQADCPGGTCEGGPFAHPCGVSTCCKPEDNNTCEDLTEKQCLSIEPVERRRMYWRGSSCEAFNCPFNTCLQQEGDCMVAHPEPGCRNSFCCSYVCKADPYCCQVEWDRQCASEVAVFCNLPPVNDECSSPKDNRGALEVSATSSTLGDGVHATENANDPGFCCHREVPGARGGGTVWYKFVATHTSAQLDTLLSDPPADDSLIQVFTAEDLSTDETACSSLIPIGCNDDSVGEDGRDSGDGRDGRSRLCVVNLVRGETYYVLVAAKTSKTMGRYRLTIESPCPTAPPLNDDCSDAEELGKLLTAYDLTSSHVECPVHDCTGVLGRDVWFDYVATCDGLVKLGTCTPSKSHAYAGLVVYQGCDCPPDKDAIVACGQAQCCRCVESEPVSFDAVAGQCYKIRLGNDIANPLTDAAELRVECLPDCPTGEVQWLDPPDCVVDARQPHPADAPEVGRGIDTLLVEAPPGAAQIGCWTISETEALGSSNSILYVVDNEDGTVNLHLARAITPHAITAITYTRRDGRKTTGLFTSHPANVDGDIVADRADVAAMIDVVTGVTSAPWGKYGSDCNHTGATTPGDILCLIDLLNGANGFAPGWNGTRRPTNPERCR